jgi:hypothetical protein
MRLSLPVRLETNHLLAAAATFLAAIAFYPWLAPLAAPDASGRPGETPRAAAGIAPVPAFAAFSAALDRPLFSPSRRPAATANPAGSGLAGRYRLLGLVSAGDARHALIADGERRFEIAEGATLEGWTVARIEQDRVLLSSSSGRAVLTLRRAAELGAEAPAAPKPGR